MAKVLVLGAGFVAGPLVNTLLNDPRNELTVASQFLADAEKLAGTRQRVKAQAVDVNDDNDLHQQIAAHDIVVSLVPYQFHAQIARQCIATRRHLITASYENNDIKALSAEAKSAGITVLNEMGLDPGIDHLSAMKIIDEVHADDGRILSFESWCGGLPSPSANTNPLGYKFSWAPRSVLQALLNNAKYLKNGQQVQLTSDQLLAQPETLQISDSLVLEGYPNRDSMGYQHVYGLRDVNTMLRGTLRYPGFCDILQSCKALGLLNTQPDERLMSSATPITWSQLLPDANRQLANASAQVKDAIKWLGVLSDAVAPAQGTVIDAFCELLKHKLSYQVGETDMVVLQHRFEVRDRHAKTHWRYSTLVCEGEPGGVSAMAKTVGVPCALAAQLLLDGGISQRGSILPITSSIYTPLLKQLAMEGIRFEEVDRE
mgnify:CR=1 FL=1